MRKAVFYLFFLWIPCTAHAQEKYFYINLDINVPLSNTSWIDDVSTRGGKIGYRAFINERFSAGLDVGWSGFDQYHPTETIEYSNGALTTDYYKFVYSYSFVASGQYYLKGGYDRIFFPYVGIGLGANTNEYLRQYNIYEEAERAWGFVARPEAGILVKFGSRRTIGAMAAIHYDFSTNSSETYGYRNFNSAGIQIGLIFGDL